MRYAIPTLFLILACLVLQSWFNKAQQANPVDEAKAFLCDIQSGNISKIVRHFGSNICHCPKRKGWGAYLAYQTDEEPNLAFLVGKPFTIGQISKKHVASSKKAHHGIPWEEPQDYLIDVQIVFDPKNYAPLFIPLSMAYGKTITEVQLAEFSTHPGIEYWKSFTLRLRKSLNNGAIAFDTRTIEPDVSGEFKFLKDKPSTEVNKNIAWLIPKDAGEVITAGGKTVNASIVENELPHLCSTVIELRIVRSAKLQPWTVAEFELKNSILEKGKESGFVNLPNIIVPQPQ